MQLNAFILIGVPGSGKSTYGEKFAKDHDYVYLSSDRNRARVGNGEEDQKASARAFSLLKEEMGQALNQGKSVVVDATFVSKKARRDFVNVARSRGAKLTAITFEVTREVALARNKKRASEGGRDVPAFVIDRMLSNYEKPEPPEFDEVFSMT